MNIFNIPMSMPRFIYQLLLLLTVAVLSVTTSNIANAAFVDRVLVIVNEDIITQSEFDYRKQRVLNEIKNGPNAGEVPPDFSDQILKGMISDRIQIQEANRRGIEITDEQLEGALVNVAARQNMTVQQFKEGLIQSGESLRHFQETVRESITISQLTEYYARSRVIVPEYEIEDFIKTNNLDQDDSEYQIAHILIKNPEQNQALAEQVREEISLGLSFQEAAMTYSEADNAGEGGLMGWRSANQLPEIYLNAIKDINVGEVTPVLKNPNGLYILKLLDLKGDRTEILQSNVRHILISAETEVAKSQAAKKLLMIRDRIINGEGFSDLARIFSDDSVSAANGGSLDWVSPGQMVPQFEEAFQQLPIGEVSQPVFTQYGVHILEVIDRRKKNITHQMVRNRADNYLRRQRAEREYGQWVRELREQAYIEHVSKPV